MFVGYCSTVLLVNSFRAITHLGGNMKRFVQLITAGIALLFLGMGTLLAQEVSFSTGPTIAPALSAANGGFSWGDLLNNGNLDVFTPSTSVMINNITSFVPAVSTMTQNITLQPNGVGALLADFNGDGVLDLFTTNGGTPASGLYYNTAGVFTWQPEPAILPRRELTEKSSKGLRQHPSITAITLALRGLETSQVFPVIIRTCARRRYMAP